MFLNHRSVWISGLLCLCAATAASAAMMDYDRTASGADTPFSEQVKDTPTPWELFGQPMALTEPAYGGERWVFSEGSGTILGQLLLAGQTADRMRWIITDYLAWIPVPQILYLDPQAMAAVLPYPVNNGAGYQPLYLGGPVGGGGSAQAQQFFFPFFPPVVIPSPSTAGLVLAGGLLALFRRR